MIIENKRFQELINQELGELPGEHAVGIKNVAILFADDPTPEQREKLKLRDNQTLFGLYEGVPLSMRQGMQPSLPDTITLFKNPICQSVNSENALREQIKHTLWHEIAHYYGLNHDQIHNLE